MTLKYTHLFFLLFLPLFSCGSDDPKDSTDILHKKDQTIVLSPNGVGPINATSSFNMHQMTLAFNNFNVVEEVGYEAGTPYPVIRVSEGVKTLLIINPDESQQNIFSVIIEDNLIKNSLGHHLGMPFNKIYAYGQTEDCQLGTQDMSGKVLCYAPKVPNILYVFNGKTNVTNNKIPPSDVLQGWALETIIWRPK